MSFLPRTRGLLAALGLALAAPALTQPITIVTEGVLGPCTENHFEPDRYLTAFAEAGWRPVPDAARPIAVEYLAQAFLPMTHPRPTSRTETVADRITRAVGFWTDEVEGRTILFQFDSVLFLRGHVDADGAQLLQCFLVTPDADFVDGLIAQADTEGVTSEGLGVVATFGPDPLDDRTVLGLSATRQPGPDGTAHGLKTELIRLSDP